MGKLINQKNTTLFQNKLLKWYSENGRSFPWRNKSLSNYQVVIAEILLQKTKAETVARFYKDFIKEYPNWKSIVDAKLEDIENHLKPVGLYKQRSVRLQQLSIEMVRRRSRFPRKREELESIPFIGQYIANAIELIVYNQPAPLIDVNMARVLERYFGARKMADIRYDPYLQELASKVTKIKNSKEINWAILDFAALVCKARNPACSSCLLKASCKYYSGLEIS